LLNSKNKIRILIADKIALDGIKLLSPKNFTVIYNINLSNSDILKKYNDFDVLAIRSTRIIDKWFLDKCNFKIIATCTKGTDHIDVKTAKEKNIKIINSETGNVVSAAEHTFALILEISKNIKFSDCLVRENKFSYYNYKRTELRGKKIGIVGFGRVGSRVAKYAKAFEMIIYANDIDVNVKKNNRKIDFKSLDFILKNADIVTLHIPLNDDNVNFISGLKLKLLTDNTILINTSRGGIIDEKYLIELLAKRKIYYAGLDVFKNEPKINKLLFMLKNVILTNHIAGKTEDSLKYISNDIFMQVKKHFTIKQNL
jgi:D-3-phosphoglycerate dehydrogenase / 2-oxoglutarate reductase